MERNNLKKILAKLDSDIDTIADEQVKSIQKSLLNIIEYLLAANDDLREENQTLRDENNRLKGEQGRPSIRKQSQDNQDHSSEKDRKPRGQEPKKKKKTKKKKHNINVDRQQVCDVDPNLLPSDAVFKGYQKVVVQDSLIKTDNIEFLKKCYYSPSQHKTFMADLPAGYHGEFGPNIKALVVGLHQSGKMTESAICDLLTEHGVIISPATISRFITDGHALFHQEKAAIVAAGLASSAYQQMDDTGARVGGKNHYTHILCNPFYTAFFTRRRKDRLTVLDILSQGKLCFTFGDAAYALMEQMNLSNKQLLRLKAKQPPTNMTRKQVEALLLELFPNPKKHATNRRIILEASALIAYQQSPQALDILLTDDAPQFKQITRRLALCWVHDGRHYKKLRPHIPSHRTQLDDFLKRYWDYYHQLIEYKKSPEKSIAEVLKQEFDRLFSIKTGYQQLDDRIERTKCKKEALLLVLDHPSLPLHNNNSELGARVQARYRDISLHTIDEKGTQAKDTFMTIVATAKKLGVNAYQYILDRITKKYDMVALAEMIKINAKAIEFNSS